MLGAIVIGLLFGLFLQRGGFCGAALLSSVILEKDKKGVLGILLAISVSMIGFALLTRFGVVTPNPKKFSLLPAIVGGLVFGVGMVLAGGCVTGSLFKAAEGRLTSFFALVGVAIGTIAMGAGGLAPLKKALSSMASVSVPPSIPQAIGVPFWILGLIVGGLGAVIAFHLLKKAEGKRPVRLNNAWPTSVVAIGVGVLGWAAYVSSAAGGRNYPLGATGGVKAAFAWLVAGKVPRSTWLITLVASCMVGSFISARMRGKWQLKSADPQTLLIAFIGGLLVGAAAVLGHGCFIGHGISGVALLSFQSLLFGVCMVVANWVTTLLYLRGL